VEPVLIENFNTDIPLNSAVAADFASVEQRKKTVLFALLAKEPFFVFL
jgi:hypothetical protein